MTAEIEHDTPPSIKLQLTVFAGLFMITLCLHLPIFWRSVMDWDESLYLLMAEQWQAGHLPYTTIWDNKPIGIYAIFLVFVEVFKNGLFAIRFATIIFTTLTAFAVFRLTALCIGRRKHQLIWSVIAAIVFTIGALSNDGLSANTEIFMTCFTSYAMLCALKVSTADRDNGWTAGLSGLLIGCAIMTKYVAVFELPAVLLALMFNTPAAFLKIRYRVLISAMIGVLVPAAFTIILYGATGHLDIWWQDSVASNYVRVAANVPQPNLYMVADEQAERWLPFYMAPIILLVTEWRPVNIPRRNLLFIWFVGGGIGVSFAKSFFDHYFLQLLPVMSIMLVYCLATLTYPLKYLYAAALLVPLHAGCVNLQNACAPVVTLSNQHLAFHGDTTAKIAADLKASLQSSQMVYVFDDQPIIYSMISQTPPTKYVLPSVLTTYFLASVAHVDSLAEIKRIIALSPEFIVRSRYPAARAPNRNEMIYSLMNDVLSKHYTLWKQYDVSDVYRIK